MDAFRTDSRRSAVLSLNGAVACGDVHATDIGIDMLKAGGNAADVAVAMAAALSVTEPMSTGVGGDAFCLYYNAADGSIKGLNGCGRAPSGLSMDHLATVGFDSAHPWPATHGLTVTVPGAAAALVDTVAMFGSGKFTLADILQPAISLAEHGHAVGQLAAYHWNKGLWKLTDERNTHSGCLLVDGRAPRWGEVFHNPQLANTLKKIAVEGKPGFYSGEVAAAIVEVVQKHGGVLTLKDMAAHTSTRVDPISTDFDGTRLWEMPPNGQGIVALMVLNLLKGFHLKAMGHNTADYLHHLIEAFRLSFVDAAKYVSDPSQVDVPTADMLSAQYAHQRRKLMNPQQAIEALTCSKLPQGGDTVYLTTMDKNGNACSFIMSNFQGFGTGIVPLGCGFPLQNRGYNFSFDKASLNCVAPGKRPYHTIIPAMLTRDKTGELLASYGVMGGFMQPQGHVQVLLNMLLFGMDPQTALNQPRFCIDVNSKDAAEVRLEEGIPQEVINDLRYRGHKVNGPVFGHARAVFGRGHVITRGAWWSHDEYTADDQRVVWAGSDPRADGKAAGY